MHADCQIVGIINTSCTTLVHRCNNCEASWAYNQLLCIPIMTSKPARHAVVSVLSEGTVLPQSVSEQRLKTDRTALALPCQQCF